eukprot:CAMPEP_0116083188 /NCGR_PEP_ID=MMETSP0327-20121206/3133_1 /TAXON_ID=44447 /ORGANISM="Pseudo-nitzschia delicatissima, Strain B596" /LENGTH=127 /DNA_ID=CAMNT_0003574045 /DNA_START=594 /DNA_END=974 /DNA_ORIENTATION=+
MSSKDDYDEEKLQWKDEKSRHSVDPIEGSRRSVGQTSPRRINDEGDVLDVDVASIESKDDIQSLADVATSSKADDDDGEEVIFWKDDSKEEKNDDKKAEEAPSANKDELFRWNEVSADEDKIERNDT